MTLVRLKLAELCWRAAGALTPFVEAACRDARPSLPRIVLARLSLRLVCRLMLAGERLAPEAAP